MVVASPAVEWKPLDRSSIIKIIRRLNKRYGYERYKDNPFNILVHGILSARTKDEVTFPFSAYVFVPSGMVIVSVKFITPPAAISVRPATIAPVSTSKRPRFEKLLIFEFEEIAMELMRIASGVATVNRASSTLIAPA